MKEDLTILNGAEQAIVQPREEEIWKPVEGFEGLYEVSSLGRIRSLSRYVKAKDGRKPRLYEGRMLKPFSNKKGYLYIILCDNNGNHKRDAIHRLVAKAFIPNDVKERYDIDHKDSNRANNSVENLRWVTRKENCQNPITKSKYENKVCKSVIRLGRDGDIKEYLRMTDVKADGFRISKVCSCCKGQRYFHKGFVWAYKGTALKEYDFYLKQRDARIAEGVVRKRNNRLALIGG